jgi:hypothetical protein
MKTASGLRFGLHRRRLTAVHQAGHAVVAASLGLRVQTWIWPTYRAGEEIPLDPRVWLGWTRHEAANQESTRLVAVAGAIAEASWRRAHGRSGANVGDWQESMSDLDWKSTGCDPGKPDAECLRAAEWVKPMLEPDGVLWGRLCRMARDIIIASRTATPDDAAPELHGAMKAPVRPLAPTA